MSELDRSRTTHVLDQIAGERKRQDAKWGEQNHDMDRWVVILGEEFGEVAKAAFERNDDECVTELIQVAAVAVAAVECILRKREAQYEVSHGCLATTRFQRPTTGGSVSARTPTRDGA